MKIYVALKTFKSSFLGNTFFFVTLRDLGPATEKKQMRKKEKKKPESFVTC